MTIFKNPHLVKTPPERPLYQVYHEGVSSKHVPYMLRLTPIKMSETRKHIKDELSAPRILGNWDLMNEWVENMWEALYNPIWLWKKPKGGYGVMHGHHRYRLLDAMSPVMINAYVLDARHYKIGDLQLPPRVKELMKLNDREPVRGTVSGVCIHCGYEGRWSKKTFNRISDVRLYCKSCEGENPYPWRGRL